MATYLPHDRLIVGYGLDPGLRHGALVRSTFHFSPELKTVRLREVQLCFRWTKRSSLSVTTTSSYEQFQRLGNQIVASIDGDIGIPVAIDWDRMSVYWSKTGLQLVQVAYLIGYVTRGWQITGHPVITMEPGEIRKAFGLKERTQKDEVWAAFKEKVVVDEEFERQLHDAYADTLDAVILSYFVAKAQYTLDDLRIPQPQREVLSQ